MVTAEYLKLPWPGNPSEDRQTLILSGCVGEYSAFPGLCKSYYLRFGWSRVTVDEPAFWLRETRSVSVWANQPDGILAGGHGQVRMVPITFAEQVILFRSADYLMLPAFLPAVLLEPTVPDVDNLSALARYLAALGLIEDDTESFLAALRPPLREALHLKDQNE